MLQRQQTDNGFDRSRRAERMAHHTFRLAHRYLAEQFHDLFPLSRVVEDGGGAVCINVTDLFWLKLRLGQRLFHSATWSAPVGIRLRQMMVIGRNSVANYLAKNFRATPARG